MKGKKVVWGLYCLVLFLALAFRPSSSKEATLWKKYFVRIINDLGAGEQLVFKCLSDDDTIGPRSVPPNQQFEFGFRLGLDTSFECNGWYSNFEVYFFAFNPKQIGPCGGVHCIWSARPTGMYLYNIKTKEYAKRYDWVKIKP